MKPEVFERLMQAIGRSQQAEQPGGPPCGGRTLTPERAASSSAPVGGASSSDRSAWSEHTARSPTAGGASHVGAPGAEGASGSTTGRRWRSGGGDGDVGSSGPLRRASASQPRARRRGRSLRRRVRQRDDELVARRGSARRRAVGPPRRAARGEAPSAWGTRPCSTPVTTTAAPLAALGGVEREQRRPRPRRSGSRSSNGWRASTHARKPPGSLLDRNRSASSATRRRIGSVASPAQTRVGPCRQLVPASCIGRPRRGALERRTAGGAHDRRRPAAARRAAERVELLVGAGEHGRPARGPCRCTRSRTMARDLRLRPPRRRPRRTSTAARRLGVDSVSSAMSAPASAAAPARTICGEQR